MNSPNNTKTQDKLTSGSVEAETIGQEQEACACCAVFFSDYAIQELEQRWDNPRSLRALINELLEEGFGHFAKPILWRWRKLVPNSPDYSDFLCRISDQIWIAGTSKQIHELDKPMTDADIERAVTHDMVLLEQSWRKHERTQKRNRCVFRSCRYGVPEGCRSPFRKDVDRSVATLVSSVS